MQIKNNSEISWCTYSCCSVAKLCLTLFSSMDWQHTRLPCPSPSPRACSNSCPLSQWCHPIISSSITPFPSCPQSFPASGSFPKSGLFASGGQNVGAAASVLPMNIQGWFTLALTGLISLQSKGLSRVFSSTTVLKHQLFGALPSLRSSCHICNGYWKDHNLNYLDLCWQSIYSLIPF